METFLFLQLILTHNLFKSYYVVWKLFQRGHINQIEVRFKSYYVVWKPDKSATVFFGKYRLNRTM